MEFDVFDLKNGIRLIHKRAIHSKIAHCGIFFDIGSRDESEPELGMAHFWEHMAFKGTERRKAFHIANRLESLGGEINAYTTKEKICFYASVLDSHIDKALELLKDISFHSVFPEKEIKKEKSVILEEMGIYRDSPEDSILDEFEEVFFEGHPLAHNILGYPGTIENFTQDALKNFISKNLNTHKVVISVVSPEKSEKIKKRFEKYFDEIPELNGTVNRDSFLNNEAKLKEICKSTSQTYCIMGLNTVEYGHPDRLPLFLMSNLLGGPALNSRLNLSLREKHGLVYNVEAQLNTFTDTGLMNISFSTEKRNLKKAQKLIFKELNQLKERKLGTRQLNIAKQQLMGQIAMAEENNLSFMLMMGRSLLDKDEIDSINQIFQKINDLDAGSIREVANKYFDQSRISILSYIPE